MKQDLARCAQFLMFGFVAGCVDPTTPRSANVNPDASHVDVDGYIQLQKSAVLATTTSARTDLKFNELYYVTNDTWIAGDQTPLGTVFVIRPEGGRDCSVGSARVLEETEYFVPVNLDSPVKPEKLKSLLIDKKVAADLSVLSFVSVSMGTEDVLSVTMTNEPRHIRKDPQYALELAKFKATAPGLWKESCLVGIVTSFARHTLTYRKYSKASADANAGAYGVKVNGSYYSSDEDEEINYIFGLNIVPLEAPAASSASSDAGVRDSGLVAVASDALLRDVTSVKLRH